MIKVLIVEPFTLPYEKEIQNTLEAKQEIVDGYIECVNPIDDDSVCFICNEYGKFNGSSPNRDIGHDILFGTFIIAKDNYETGEFESLDENQIQKYKEKFDEE